MHVVYDRFDWLAKALYMCTIAEDELEVSRREKQEDAGKGRTLPAVVLSS